MALIRWEPVRELSTIQNEMNRLFNTFFETPSARQRRSGDAAVGPGDGPRRDRATSSCCGPTCPA